MRLRLAPGARIAILDGELARLPVEFHMEEDNVGEAIHDMEIEPGFLVESGDGKAERTIEPLDDLHSVHSNNSTPLSFLQLEHVARNGWAFSVTRT
ncbi:hypothetical protein AB3G45_28240 [Shinella sp. S4-D37]|uniref:hypothetical protein n=1 Tax=Shinella sp. S4-D37 TaxID=3161999 RepID=UPI003466FBE0